MIKQIAMVATVGLLLTIGALTTIYAQQASGQSQNRNERNSNGFFSGECGSDKCGVLPNPGQNGQNPP